MPGWLLNLCYLLLVLLCSPVLLWRSWRQGKYRSGWGQKFLGLVPPYSAPKSSTPRIMLHAVSVGEVLQLQQVLTALRREFPTAEFIVSTTTSTGYQVACDKLTDAHVVYLPLDFTWAVNAALNRLQPDLFVLVELELWPNLLRISLQRGIRVGLINGRLSERSHRGYRYVRWLLGPLLRRFAFVAVQSDEYRERFVALGADPARCQVTGSIKFDGLRTDRDQPLARTLRELFQICDDEIVFIAGSTQEPEEQIAIDVYQSLAPRFPQLRLIIVPRHPERGEAIARLIERAGQTVIRRSQATSGSTLGVRPVGLLDTVGELSACWALATIAFVGGSFGNRGGQNMLEPAAYGAAVCFGPNTRNFRQIVELLLQQEVVRRVSTPAALQEFVEQMLSNPDQTTSLGTRAQQLVLTQQGATGRTIELIRQTLGAAGMSPTVTQPLAEKP